MSYGIVGGIAELKRPNHDGVYYIRVQELGY